MKIAAGNRTVDPLGNYRLLAIGVNRFLRGCPKAEHFLRYELVQLRICRNYVLR